MARSPKKTKATEAAVDNALLAAITEATNGEAGYMFVSTADSEPLVAAGLVEVNYELGDDEGRFATRAIANAGDGANEESNNMTEATEATAPATEFAIVAVPLPAAKRLNAGTRGSKYPFDKLELGQSFFVPATDEMPDPARSLASSVSAASRRYATVTGEKVVKFKGADKTVKTYSYERKFAIRAVADGAAWGATGVKGAVIGRVEPTADEG